MMTIIDRIVHELEAAKRHALEVYEANRDNHSSPQSIAFDSGRYDGLKEALEIIHRLQ